MASSRGRWWPRVGIASSASRSAPAPPAGTVARADGRWARMGGPLAGPQARRRAGAIPQCRGWPRPRLEDLLMAARPRGVDLSLKTPPSSGRSTAPSRPAVARRGPARWPNWQRRAGVIPRRPWIAPSSARRCSNGGSLIRQNSARVETETGRLALSSESNGSPAKTDRCCHLAPHGGPRPRQDARWRRPRVARPARAEGIGERIVPAGPRRSRGPSHEAKRAGDGGGPELVAMRRHQAPAPRKRCAPAGLGIRAKVA